MKCDEAADHYTHLVQQPSWRHYVKQRVKEMDADSSGLYRGLYEMVKQRLAEIEGEQDE